MHYVADLSQVQIAKQLGLSTATISRLLQRARAEGVVRIEVRDMHEPDELRAELTRRLGLVHVEVVQTPSGNPTPLLAVPLSRMLSASDLRPGGVLTIGWGRTVSAVIEAGLPPLPGVLVVPSTGGMQQHARHFQSNELSRRAAELTGGVPHFVHAPWLPDPETLPLFLAESSVQESVALWDRIDVAVVGIGQPWRHERPPGEEAAAADPVLIAAAGDVVRHYFDAAGQVLDWRGEGRMIAVSAAQLRAARQVIGLAVGESKVPSILGAARAGLVKSLITDSRTAESLVEALEQGF
jgi:DNA-binding transcriptional regulator LsrR (DeoR family)